ncbi:hypothetical protein C7S20_10765 [Christiangramia fulva]|uniref:Bacterial spore germination immunoglobulin-like domain-containing protein n=1 Tax=Christiangramia fulva TaxID=2126553 RepID=A0A2R3Z5Z1_9FLAO|nr:Gmad2 immunoglobulin-like domain-containing protein [Christiangramia fulva]AVR45697.1 hypothetical protein C7S20_10765 [Christiangramia fulva]
MRSLVFIICLFLLIGCKNSTQEEGSSARMKDVDVQNVGGKVPDWVTYFNEKWRFSLKYPVNYEILESEIAGAPVINIYPVSNLDKGPYGIHGAAKNAYLAILPMGLGVDAPTGKRKNLQELDKEYFPGLPLNKKESIAYLLENGEAWAFFLRFEKKAADNWGENAGIFVHFRVNDLQKACIDKNGNKVSMDNCSPPGEGRVVLKGNIEKGPKEKLMKILDSFRIRYKDSSKMANRIKVEKPSPESEVSSPIKIKGKARGNWFFEGSAPVELVDQEGNELARTNIRALDEWMTEDFVDFSGTLKFEPPEVESGYLVFFRANPSDIAEKEETLRVPVKFPQK